MKLTEQTIAALEPQEKRYSRSDHGLAIEILPTGTKSFVCWRRGRKTVLGRWPEMKLKDARAALSKLITEESGTATSKPKMTFRTFVEGPYKLRAAAQRKRGDLTLQRLRHVFMVKHPLIADMDLKKVTQEHIEDLVVAMRRGPDPFKDSTTARELSDLKHVFNKAVEWEYIRRSPAANVKPPRLDPEATKLYMAPSEVERLRKALEEWKHLGDLHDSGFHEHPPGRGFYGNPYPRWFYVLIRVLMNTGLRKTEATTLTWGNIDFEMGSITVQGDRAKSGKTRRVPISKSLQADLAQWYALAHAEEYTGGADAEGDPEFSFTPPNKAEPVWPVKSFRKPWERLRTMADLGEEFTPHLLRHHFASVLVNEHRQPLPRVKKLLGHADIQTTMRYLSVRQEDLQEAVDLL